MLSIITLINLLSLRTRILLKDSDNKDTGYAGDNKDNVITKEASKDQKEHSSNSDQNTENSTEIGKLQVDVKLEQPVHGGEKQKITVKVTNSSLEPIKGAKVTRVL